MKAKTDIGYGAKPPKEKCDSRLCPWHGQLKVRGRSFTGEVAESRAMKTAAIVWDYYHYVPKYERYERRRTRINVHNPDCIGVKKGDTVRIVECRPLSKSKSFVIIEKIEGEEK